MSKVAAYDDVQLAREASPIDALVPCWRCDGDTDDDGYCSGCGAVTIPRRPETDAELAELLFRPRPRIRDDHDALVGLSAGGREVREPI